MINRTKYRIVPVKMKNYFQVQKKREADWRYDNSFGDGTISDLVERIEDQIC